MGNVIRIAEKEFTDLLNDKFVLIVIVAFLLELLVSLYFSIRLYDQCGVVSNFGLREKALLKSINGGLAYRLVNYGSIIGMVIGLSAISGERYGHALSTLTTKPVYRDTVINGKIIGTMLFLALVMSFISLIYVAAMFFIVGSSISQILIPLIVSLPFVIISSLIGASIFLALSLLVSNICRDQSTSVLVSLVVWLLLTQVVPTSDVTWYLSVFFDDEFTVQRLIESLSPTYLIQRIFWELPAGVNDIVNGIIASVSDIVWLLVYLLITVVLSYIVMLRRDVV